MPKKTAKGMHCGPGRGKNGASCYTKAQLTRIANAYNQKYNEKINTRDNKTQLWDAIEKRMAQHCDSEWCWLDDLDLSKDQELLDVFVPVGPKGKTEWLSTSHIRKVLKQYESMYPDFAFLGPVPLDFCSLAANEVCNINLKSAKRNGISKIGIVFNTDPSTDPGKHWISMFIDISHPDPAKHEVGYFDSFGIAPLLPEIRKLVVNLKKQNPDIKLKLNCKDDICTHAVQHQKDNTECGMYSINYITTRLTGQSWEDTVLNRIWSDNEMIGLRKKYFRPGSGTKHRY
jgi:hypothetical protein